MSDEKMIENFNKIAYHLSMSQDALVLRNLTLTYQRHPAVHHLSGVFPKGSMTALMGPNGGGKSTLLKALAGLHPIDEGLIERSESLSLRNTAYLPQTNNWDRQFPLTVFELAAQALLPELGLWKRRTSTQSERVFAALEQVGLAEYHGRSIGSLSLGQFQRTLFARVIVQDAQVILLDEPLNGLDERSSDSFFDLLHHWNREEKTLIVVLHDRSLALRHFPTTLILAQERIAWGPSHQVLQQSLWHQALAHQPLSLSEETCWR